MPQPTLQEKGKGIPSPTCSSRASQGSIMGWLLVDNDILSLEQPPEEADWAERERRSRRKPGLGRISI